MARRLITSGSPYEALIGFSRAVRLGDRVVVSGTAPVLPDGDCPESAGEQAARCLEIIAEALAEAGASMDDVVRTRQYIRDRADAEAVSNAHRACFSGVRPASTMILVAGFLDPRWRVEIEAEAVVAD